MFDIGFAELIIIGVVALLVIGPERLPGAVRTASAWINRFRRGFNEIKQEVQQELHNDEIMRDLRESRDQLRRETESLKQDLNKPFDEAKALTDDLGLGTAPTADSSSTITESTEQPDSTAADDSKDANREND